MRILMTLLMVLVTQQADAQLFRRPMKRVVVRQQVLAVSPVQTLFLVAPPSYYGAPSYTPPQEARRRGGGNQEIIDTLARVVSTIVALEGRIVALEKSTHEPPEPVEPAFPDVRLPTVIVESCAKCHGGDKSKGDFRLSELGNPNKLLMAQAMVANAKMPLDAQSDPVELPPHVRAELFDALKKMEPEK